MSKQSQVEGRIKRWQKQLDNAEKYLAEGKNIEGRAWLHLDDWTGKSGHPDWVRNFLIPRIKKEIGKCEEVIERISQKEKELNEQASILPAVSYEEEFQERQLFGNDKLYP